MTSSSRFDRFRAATRFQWERSMNAPSTQRLLNGAFTQAQLAMLTLQMFHYVKHTVALFEEAITFVPDGEVHLPLRTMLRFFAEDEAGHDRIALRDLGRMGYDVAACEATLPLPATLDLHGANGLAVKEYGPYYLVGETYATETVGAELSRRIQRAYAGVAEVAFYAVHAEADVGHAAKSEAVVRHALTLPGAERLVTLGYLTALHNLRGLAEAVEESGAFPAAFQLPPKRTAA